MSFSVIFAGLMAQLLGVLDLFMGWEGECALAREKLPMG